MTLQEHRKILEKAVARVYMEYNTKPLEQNTHVFDKVPNKKSFYTVETHVFFKEIDGVEVLDNILQNKFFNTWCSGKKTNSSYLVENGVFVQDNLLVGSIQEAHASIKALLEYRKEVEANAPEPTQEKKVDLFEDILSDILGEEAEKGVKHDDII